MRPLTVDIETTARPDAAEFLPPIEAPANYRDAEKIRAYIEERRAKQLEAAALDAALGRILCVGLLRDGAAPQFIAHDDEATLLRDTWQALANREQSECFTTFCGHRFDFPFLARRSVVCGVPIPDWFPRDGRFPRHAFCDLAELWQCGDRSESISLDRLAKLCGLPGKTGDGAQFGLLWSTDRAAALRYLENDLRLTAALYQRMTSGAFCTEDSPG